MFYILSCSSFKHVGADVRLFPFFKRQAKGPYRPRTGQHPFFVSRGAITARFLLFTGPENLSAQLNIFFFSKRIKFFFLPESRQLCAPDEPINLPFRRLLGSLQNRDFRTNSLIIFLRAGLPGNRVYMLPLFLAGRRPPHLFLCRSANTSLGHFGPGVQVEVFV